MYIKRFSLLECVIFISRCTSPWYVAYSVLSSTYDVRERGEHVLRESSWLSVPFCTSLTITSPLQDLTQKYSPVYISNILLLRVFRDNYRFSPCRLSVTLETINNNKRTLLGSRKDPASLTFKSAFLLKMDIECEC